jgi:predicted DNA-binding transcriptional regulator YafY
MKVDRLIAILLYLLSHHKVTARELASCFSVTLRTIYRDMEALGLAGVPIVSSQGMEGGYGLVESYTIDRTFFREEELASIFTTLKGVNAAIKDRALENVLLKLKALSAMGGVSREKSEELPSVVYAPLAWGMPSGWTESLDAIRKAIERRRVLSFMYTKSGGDGARRAVEPISLVLQADIWYLYAWDRDKADYRFFRLSRISAISTEPVAFVRKPGRKPYPWEAGWEAEPPMDLRLVFTPRAAQKARDVFSWAVPEALEDGSLAFTLRFPYGDWVDSQILSFGPEVEVIEPDWLRERIRSLGAMTAARYTPPNPK